MGEGGRKKKENERRKTGDNFYTHVQCIYTCTCTCSIYYKTTLEGKGTKSQRLSAVHVQYGSGILHCVFPMVDPCMNR